MFVECFSLLCGLLVYKYLDEKDIRRLKKRWSNALTKCKIQGIRNVDDETFLLNKVIETKYGFTGCCNLPDGLNYETLESGKVTLEDNLGCKIEIEKMLDKKKRTYAKIDFIYKNVNDKKFEIVRTKPYQLFLGYRANGKPYLLDITIDPHILIAGTTGTGKTSLLFSILTNLIYNNANETEIYLLQIAKGELNCFKDCKNVKIVANTIEESLVVLKRISKILDERSELFAQYGIRNIKQWNKLNKNKPMKYIYVVPEEFSFFMVGESEDEDIKDTKVQCWTEILKIAKLARACGITLLSVLQRSTATNINTDVKALLSRISFRQKSVLNSSNIINTSDAVKLKQQEFILDGNADYIQLKSPFVDDDNEILSQYVKEIKVAKPIKNSEEQEKNKKDTSINSPNKSYRPEKSEIIDITPEEYYARTGYCPLSIRDKIKPIKEPIENASESVTSSRKKKKVNNNAN